MGLAEWYEWVLGRLGYGGGRPGIHSFLEELGPRRLVFFRAPTGYGKTTASMALGAAAAAGAGFYDKVLHVLPLRSIVEDGYGKAARVLGDGAAARMMGVSGSPFMLGPLVFVTVDTFLLAAAKLNTRKMRRVAEGREWGYDYFTQASVLASLVVFDEAHMVFGAGGLGGFAYTVFRFLLEAGVPVVVETATLPERWERRLRRDAERMGYEAVSIGLPRDDSFLVRERGKVFRVEPVEGAPACLVEEGRRNLVIVNTVERAVDVYRELKCRGLRNVYLLHGRMAAGHRRRVVEAVREIAGREGAGEYYIVATQVAEAGLDVTSDVLVTDVAPLMNLLQRMGRCARYEEPGGVVKVVMDAPTVMYEEEWRYELERSKRIIEGLDENFHPRLPERYQSLIDKAYSRFRSKEDRYLLGEIMDPGRRSVDVWRTIKERYGGGVGRGVLLTLEVPEMNDIMPVSERLLEKLYRRDLVEIRVEGQSLSGDPVGRVVEAALEWRPYSITLRRGVYSPEEGLVLGD